MATVITAREKQAGGCCTPFVEPDLGSEAAAELAVIAKALGDPTRLQIIDALRKASPEAVCQCELLPLFDMSQPALAKHLKVLRQVGLLDMERRGLWAFYSFSPTALDGIREWLG